MATVVSVLMPTYNEGRYLRDAIDSILLQTFADFELIVVDDGSTDGTADVLKEYSDSRIRVISFSQNMGRPAARNAAMDAATGKYLAWMDSDDISMPQRLEKQVAFMEDKPDVAVCSGAILSFFRQGDLWQPPPTSGAIRAGLFWGSTIANPAACMRADMVAATGVRFDPALPRAEDYSFWCSLLLDYKLKATNLPDILLLYRRTKETFHPATHDYVLERNVRRLQLPVTEETMAIYSFLAYGKKLEMGNTPKAVALWGETVIMANREAKVFPDREFTEQLLDHIFPAISKHFSSRVALLGYAVRHFPFSTVAKRAFLSFMSRIRAI